MIEYPYFVPIILTDAIYTAYGGQTGTTLPAQRNAAYLLAEIQMTEHLDAFLKPTTVTGTYPVQGYFGETLRLEMYYLQEVSRVRYLYPGWNCAVDTQTGCAFILDHRLSYVALDDCALVGCGCNGSPQFPAVAEVVFLSGLSSGNAYQPNMLLALTMAAQNNINEMFYPMALEGGAGDPGISEWSSMQHREIRVKTSLGDNAFGNSPIANKIAKLVKNVAPRPAIKLGG